MTEENYLEGLKNKTISFCHQLFSKGLRRTRALAGLLLSLSSNRTANSVVELSLSPFFQHKYASVFDAIDSLANNQQEWRSAGTKIRRICFSVYKAATKSDPSDRVYLSIDATPRPALFCKTLADRQAIVMPNPASFQKYRLEEGFNLSFLNLGNFDGKWSLPLSVKRIGIEQTSSECALEQLNEVLTDPELGLKDYLVVNTVDNGYANASFLHDSYLRHENLVTIARLKKGSKTFTRLGPPADGSYHRRYYGEVNYNILHSDVKSYKKDNSEERYDVERPSISEIRADETVVYTRQMGRRQRDVRVKIERYNDRLLRRRTGYSMKDKPVDILRIQYLDTTTNASIYKHEMYLVLSGRRRRQVGTREAQQSYISRSDIEAFFRVGKKSLLLDKLQTGNAQHLDNYNLIVQLAAWMSYLAAGEAPLSINPWEEYLDIKQAKEEQRLTMSQSIRAAASYYATLDLRLFRPPKSSGGTGRKKGARQTPRKRHSRVRKRPVKG